MRRYGVIGLAVLVAGVALLSVLFARSDIRTPPTIGITSQPHLRTFVGLGGPPPSAPAVGDILNATTGNWSGSPVSFAYLWEHCNASGNSCVTAAGATTNTSRYLIAVGDGGFSIVVVVTATYAGGQTASQSSAPTGVVSAGATFPLSVSSSGRYLRTASGQPWLMVGDSPQSGIGQLTQSAMNNYLDDRQAHGFNAVWQWLLCDGYGSFCNANGSATGDGGGAIFPFSGMSSPSNAVLCGATSQPCTTPNGTYFARVHAEAVHALGDGIVMVLDPLPTQACTAGDWYSAMLANGNGTTATNTQDYQYGVWLGNYFKDLPNIMWFSGNDFQCVQTTAANNDALAVAAGIASVDPVSNALQSLEPDFCGGGGFTCRGSSSLVDTTGASTGWGSTAQLNGSYTYSPTYAENLLAYSQSASKPMFLEEANYEGETDAGTDGCQTIRNCRLQDWWNMTSGAAGQFYGCFCTTHLTNSTSLSTIDTPGVTQLGYQTTLLSTLAWSALVPYAAGTNAFVTAGGGTCPTTGSIVSVTCVTSTETPDGTLALVYVPVSQSVTIDMSKMAGTTTAQWYDPTNGQLSTVSGSPFTAASHAIAGHGNNSAGSSDWVLVLTATAASGPAPVNTVAPYFCGSVSPAVASNTDAIGGCTVLTGQAVSGQTLRVGTGVWTNSPTSFTYQWNACTTTVGQPPTTASCASLGSANGAQTNAYTVQAGDVGKSLVPVVTAFNGTTASTSTTVSGACNHGSTPGGNGGTGAPPAVLIQWDPAEPVGCSPISAVVGTSTSTTSGTPMRYCTNSPVTCGYGDPLAGNAGVPPGTTLSTQSSLTCSSGTVNAVYVTGTVTVSGTCHITNSRLPGTSANACSSCVFSNDDFAGGYSGASAATTGTGRMTNVSAACSFTYTTTGADIALAQTANSAPNQQTVTADYLHCAAEPLNGSISSSGSYIISDECFGPCGSGSTTHNEAIYEYGGQNGLNILNNVILNPYEQTAGLFTDSGWNGQPVAETVNGNLAGTYDNNGALNNSWTGAAGDATNDPVNNNRFTYLYNPNMNCGNGTSLDGPNAPFSGNIRDDSGAALATC